MSYGSLNEHAIGIIMKEAVRRAIGAIRSCRFEFEVQQKEGSTGQMDDLVTSADKAAQEVYLTVLQNCCPGYGIVAEEDHLRIPVELNRNLYFTIDPLDGTKAFARLQSHGIGTQIALVDGDAGEVIAVAVGDAMTQEIFYFRPNASAVHRISEFNIAKRLQINWQTPLAAQYLLLRDVPGKYSDTAQRLLINTSRFKGAQTADGSIGLSMARLWKGEVGGKLLQPATIMPWDWCPVLGICRQLHLEFLILRNDGKLQLWQPTPDDKPFTMDREVLVVHGSRLNELHELVEYT